MLRQQCVQLFSLTWNIVERWKGYFEDLLYPTVTTFIEESEARDPEADSSFKLKSLRYFWGLALGVDITCPEYLRSLNVLGLF